jgi:acyl dehydratase
VTAPVDYTVVARNIDPSSDNKIHDDDVARTFGFSGALVPGVELFAYLTHPLVEAWGLDFLGGGVIDVRFRRPVYDGEEVVAAVQPSGDDEVDLALRGPDGSTRSAGAAGRSARDRADLAGFAFTPVPDPVPPASSAALRPGPLGSISENVDEAASLRYLDEIGERLPLYAEKDVVHPGALLRMVNAVLMRNAVLGPWIHTASRCRFLGVAHFPTVLRAHGVVTDTFERNGHDYVRYDALVLSDDKPVMHVDHTAIYRVGSG